jgi:hypothetical protein
MSDRGNVQDMHYSDRREVLHHIGAAAALAGLSPILPTNVLAQNKVGDLPRSIGEAGKRFRDRSLGITELTKSSKGCQGTRAEAQPIYHAYRGGGFKDSCDSRI